MIVGFGFVLLLVVFKCMGDGCGGYLLFLMEGYIFVVDFLNWIVVVFLVEKLIDMIVVVDGCIYFVKDSVVKFEYVVLMYFELNDWC